MNSNKPRKGLWLALAGWIVGFLTMLLVNDGNVGQALSSGLVIMATAFVVVTAIALAAQNRQ